MIVETSGYAHFVLRAHFAAAHRGFAKLERAIKAGQRLGFTLAEIQELLALSARRRGT